MKMHRIEGVRIGPKRYRRINGVVHKVCSGPLCKGKLRPLTDFWIMKTGPRKGKPIPQCIKCQRHIKGRPESGFVPIERVRFIFDEIESRIGRSAGIRVIGVGENFFLRLDQHKVMRVATVKKGIIALRELREKNTVRHEKSINAGAAARGYPERVPKRNRDFYNRSDDTEAAYKRERRSQGKT